MRGLLFLLIAEAAARAQGLSIGLMGGGSLTDAVQTLQSPQPYSTRWWSQSKDWIAGASLEWKFRSGFSLEADGLYRELHATWAAIEPDGTLNSVSPSPVVTWEIPVLAKYRLSRGTWRPFVEAGPSFRVTGNLNFTPSHHGFSAGVGVERRWKGFAFSPVVRYTRWAKDDVPAEIPGLSQQNQVEMMLGISRAAESSGRPLGGRVSLGVIAGWGLTRDVLAQSYNTQLVTVGPGGTYVPIEGTTFITGLRGLSVGPAIELALPRDFAVEVDAINKPLRDRTRSVLTDGTVYPERTYTALTTWQFPVLAKYRLHVGKLHPFVEAGPAFRLPVQGLSSFGASGGGGLEWQWGPARISPGVRFTRWGNPAWYNQGTFARNEASAFVGFSFGGASLAK